jgi:enamine deaminase RidA (YjgF/YER057c/UK114 family)
VTTLERLSAPGVYDPPGYSHAIKVTGARAVVFLAGQLAYDEDGRPSHRGDFAGQARQVFGNIKAHVEAAGGTLADVVKISSYVTDLRYRPEFRDIRREFFGDKGPPSTMVQVAGLAHPEHLIEVEAIAIL